MTAEPTHPADIAFDRVLIANRGEIAVRIMRACSDLGIETVAIYSDADRDGGHVRYADQAYNVGPARAADSYLDVESILDIAQRAEVDAIHPGYGFLAENAAFAKAVESSEVTWIGPSSEAMKQLGEKTRARSVMDAADVPIVPGTTDPVDSPETVRELGEEYGYPIAIKAEGGGGGRGMQIVNAPEEVESAFETAQREGEAYFDNPSVYVEKFLSSPRHIEIQILADHHGNVRHLGERDCSLQRRHQKIIEEAPSPALDAELRERIGEAARRGVAEADYTNAGTVEFLVDDGDFYFMEVNTRIQVEHTVTEEITGLDIVKWQLRIAAGQEIDFDQAAIDYDGHAIEYRINAENPAEEFAPATGGDLVTYDPPGGIGVRIEDALRQGDPLVTDYDSMIAKLVVSGSDRRECIARSRRALSEFTIDGFPTTIPFHRLMLEDETFLDATHSTAYLDTVLDREMLKTAMDRWGSVDLSDAEEPLTERSFTVEVNGKRFDVTVATDALPSDGGTAQSGSDSDEVSTAASAPTAPDQDGGGESGGEQVTADMQGTILDVNVTEGEQVDAGTVLAVLEAMKMENDVVTSRGGTVSQVLVNEGDSVDMGEPLFVLE